MIKKPKQYTPLHSKPKHYSPTQIAKVTLNIYSVSSSDNTLVAPTRIALAATAATVTTQAADSYGQVCPHNVYEHFIPYPTTSISLQYEPASEPLTLHPTPYSLQLAAYTLHPTPYTLCPKTRNPKGPLLPAGGASPGGPRTPHPTPHTPHPTPHTPHQYVFLN